MSREEKNITLQQQHQIPENCVEGVLYNYKLPKRIRNIK